MTSMGVNDRKLLEALQQARKTRCAAQTARFTQVDCMLQVLQESARLDGWTEGPAPRYWKSGGPALSELFHAPLPQAGVHASGARLQQKALCVHGVEGEIAFRLGQRVDRAQALALDESNVHQMFDGVAAAIEWVDSRWDRGLDAALALRQADLLGHGALVLSGQWTPYRMQDWSLTGCRISIDDEPVRQFRGSHPLKNPTAVLLPWLQHATGHWGTLEAGSVVTTGSWSGILQARQGSVVKLEFDGLPAVQMQFDARFDVPLDAAPAG